MSRRNLQSTTNPADPESNQGLGRGAGPAGVDRPAHGAQRPGHGTIEAPVVVIGATGTIGRAVVHALVGAGRPVIAVAPQTPKLEALRNDTPAGAVTTLAGRVASDAEAADLAERLRALGRPLAGVVVAFPHGRSAEVGVGRGRLLEQSSAALGDCLAQTVLAQHALARHLVPLLANSGRAARYVIVSGPGSEAPWAGYGHRSVAMAATRMLARVLHEEVRDAGVRLQLLSIDTPVRADPPGEHDCPDWPAAGDVARQALHLLDRTSRSDGPAEAVVSCRRAACAIGRVARAFTDVPSFLDSLRKTTNNDTPTQ